MPGTPATSRLRATFVSFVEWCREKLRLKWNGARTVVFDVEVTSKDDTGGIVITERQIAINITDTTINLCGVDGEDWLTEESLATICGTHPDSSTVKQLTVTRCPKVSEIPVSVGRFVNLTLLDFSSNSLQDLPWSFVYLRKLKVLNLSDNKLSKIPPILCHFPKLEKLILNKNYLQFLPTALLYLEQLKVLQVSENHQLTAPPLHVCEQGLDAIFKHLRKRHGRRNLWGECTQYYTESAEQVAVGNFEMKSLLETCISVVLRFKLDYLRQNYVPPLLKRHLHGRFEAQMTAVKVCKCSRCKGYFSSQANFEGHDCKQVNQIYIVQG